MLPDCNNVYGLICAPQGLRSVLRALQPFLGSAVYIDKSGFDGHSTIHIRSESAEFDSERLPEDKQHLFNGSVAGSLAEVSDFVDALSAVLAGAQIEHSFEVYDHEQLIKRIPE